MTVLSYATPAPRGRHPLELWLVPIGLFGSLLPAIFAYVVVRFVFGFNGCPHCEAPMLMNGVVLIPPSIGIGAASAMAWFALRHGRSTLAVGSMLIAGLGLLNFFAGLVVLIVFQA